MVLVAFSEVFGTARTLCEVAPGRVRPGVIVYNKNACGFIFRRR